MKNNQKKSIGLLCIDTPYFLYHLLSIGYELSKSDTVSVVFFTTTENINLVEHYSRIFKRSKIKIVHFNCIPFLHRSSNVWKYLPINIYRTITLLLNIYKLREANAIVAPLYDYIFLKRIFPYKYYIYSTHGMPSSEYALSNKITQFDLFFLFGERDRLERKRRGQLTKSNHAMVGFIKYDLIKNTPKYSCFNNDKPIILYNPHWNPEITSYYKVGHRIIDFFTVNDGYNLIFAPHVKLGQKNVLLKKKLKKYEFYTNIIIDLGSQACIDMSYTRYADIYLGDVSSQAIEFIFINPRPCLFLDLHDIKAKPNLKPITWGFGPVYNDIDNFSEKINQAYKLHRSQYKETQTMKSKTMFFKGSKSPSVLAAGAISTLLENKFA